MFFFEKKKPKKSAFLWLIFWIIRKGVKTYSIHVTVHFIKEYYEMVYANYNRIFLQHSSSKKIRRTFILWNVNRVRFYTKHVIHTFNQYYILTNVYNLSYFNLECSIFSNMCNFSQKLNQFQYTRWYATCKKKLYFACIWSSIPISDGSFWYFYHKVKQARWIIMKMNFSAWLSIAYNVYPE